ncbi:MAG TPA: hypothetical protein VIH21_01490, partial [Dehalococcoidia bacterium]
FRYARNLSDGLGLVWNPGEYVEGYSNFLWVLILAGIDKAGGDIVPTARWLGFALGVVSIAGAYAVCRELVDGTTGKAAGFVAAMLMATCGTFALWTFAGLETSLFAALTLAAVLLHFRESDGLRPPLSGAVWALVAMTRPEGPLLFAVSAAFKLVEWAFRFDGRAERSGVVRETLWLAVWFAGFAALFVPYFVWRYTTYDYFFPNTYYAKVGEGLGQYNRGIAYTAQFVREYGMWLLALVPVALALTSMRRARALYVLALVVAYGGYVVYVGGDSLLRFRFFAPIIPLAYALIASSGAALVSVIPLEERARPWRAAAAAVSVGAIVLFTLQASVNGIGVVGATGERAAVDRRVEIGRWLHDNVPDDTKIAIGPAGAVPYESQLPTIDMLGINNEHIAHRDLPLGRFAAGHEKYDSQYVLSQAPDIIILLDVFTPAPAKRADYDRLSGVFVPAYVDIVNTPQLWEQYEPRAVEIREGAWFNLLVRRGAGDVLALTQSP